MIDEVRIQQRSAHKTNNTFHKEIDGSRLSKPVNNVFINLVSINQDSFTSQKIFWFNLDNSAGLADQWGMRTSD